MHFNIPSKNSTEISTFMLNQKLDRIQFFFVLQENGLLHVPKGQGQNPQAQMLSDPNMAMDMMK